MLRLPNRKPVTKFSLVVDHGKDRGAMCLNVTTWDRLTEIVEKYALKGRQVFVQDKLMMRPYEDRSGMDRQSIDIVASTLQLLEKKQNGGATTPTAAACVGPFLPDFPDE